MDLDIMRLIDNLDRRHLTVAARPFISGAVAPGLTKEKRAELLLEHTKQERAIRENWLAQQAEQAEATRAERLKIEEELKLVKAAKEKEKMDKKAFDKEQKELAKEKAHVDKQEKRIQMLEDMARKRDEDREKAIEQAKKKAEKRALAEQKREQEVMSSSSFAAAVLSDVHSSHSSLHLSRLASAWKRSGGWWKSARKMPWPRGNWKLSLDRCTKR
jgi:hypothetical protein